MFTIGAKTEERQRAHLKALLEFHVQKPEETINKKGPQGNFSLLPGAPRPGGCVWLSRAGRLMMADPTQLRLASGREEAYQELHDSHPMPWTARREPQKLQKGQFFWTSPHVLQKMMKIRGRTHLGTCKQTLSKHKHKNSSLQGNDFSQKQSTSAAKAATTCLQVHTWRTHQKQDRTGAQTNQLWKFSLRWKLARMLSRKPVETCWLLSPVRPEKGARMFLNVKCPSKRENSLIQPNRRRSRTS